MEMFHSVWSSVRVLARPQGDEDAADLLTVVILTWLNQLHDRHGIRIKDVER